MFKRIFGQGSGGGGGGPGPKPSVTSTARTVDAIQKLGEVGFHPFCDPFSSSLLFEGCDELIAASCYR